MEELCSNERGGNEYDDLEQSGFPRGHVNANLTVYPNTPQIKRVETALPPQIGEFDGNPANWPSFRDLFITEVHNKELDPVSKLRYLQTACVGRAAETLGPW